jgi:outer membrane immunogenic protein
MPMTRIVRVGLATAAATAMAVSAQAADMPLYKAPVPVAAPISWTGFYLGGNAGGSIGTDSTRQTATFRSTALGTNELLDSAGRYNPTGWVGGGQIGYNFQVSTFVFGLEADWQRSWEKDHRSSCTPPAATLGFFGAGANGFGYCVSGEQKITNVGTARARAGIDRHGALWYVTGGLAWGTVKEADAFAGSANTTIFPGILQPGPFVPGAAAFSSSRTGWTVGGGVETMIAGGWSAKLEYLYVDLGSVSNTLPIGINPAFGPAFNTGGAASATSTSRVRDNIVPRPVLWTQV